MNFTKNYIFLGLITLNFWSNATVVSFNLWNNQLKHIALIGEHNVNLAPLSDDQCVRSDQQHNEILHIHLEKWSKSDKKIGFLIESSPDFIKNAKKIIKTKKIGLPDYFGTHITLPIFAHNKNYYFGNVNFIQFDLRTTATMSPINFMMDLFDLIEQLTEYDIIDEGFENLPEHVYGQLKEALKSDSAKKALTDTCNNIKIIDYIRSLEQIIETYKQYDTETCNKLTELKGILLKLFKENRWRNNNLIATCFSNLILGARLDDLINKCFPPFQEITLLLADMGAKVQFHAALQKYDYIVMFGSNEHAIRLNNYLQNLNFTPEISISKNISSEAFIPEESLSNEEFDGCLQLFTDKTAEPLSNTDKNICNNCKKEEAIKNNYKQCSRCKKVRYCSVECQKQDWKEHKLNCKT